MAATTYNAATLFFLRNRCRACVKNPTHIRSGLSFSRMRVKTRISAVSSINKKMYRYSPLSNYSKIC